MMDYISPNDERLFGETDSITIQNAIAAAEKDGCRKIMIPRYNARTGKNEWRIPVSIKVPSDFTVILDNCYMVQETGVYDNMFTCLYSWDFDKCTKLENEQKNIAIIGQGNVILDGGVHNHLLEKTSRKFRQPPIQLNNMFLWVNVNGLRMENLHIRNQRWWAINHYYCRNVSIKNIDFFAIPHVNNMDGIDLRLGCNHFDIQNITGRTGDDVIAMTALQSNFEISHMVEGKDFHIHDVKIRNVKADSNYLFMVRLLNHDGCNIYNIDIDTLMDVSDYTKKRPSGACVNIGGLKYAHSRPAIHGETRNITAKNMTSRSNNVVRMCRTLKDSTFSNMKTYGDNIDGIGVEGYCDVENVTFEHLWYGALQQEIYTSRMLNPEDYRGAVLNLHDIAGDITVRDVHADQVKDGIIVSGKAKVTVDGFTCRSVHNLKDVAEESTLILDGEVQ